MADAIPTSEELAPRRSRWWTAATVLFLLAAFGFLAAALARNVDSLLAFDWEVRPLILLGSLAALVVSFLWGVWIWRMVLLRFGVRTAWRPLCRTWFLSNLGRYIPGKVWQFVGAAQLGAETGLSRLTVVSSLLVHTGVNLVAATAVCLAILPAHLDLPGAAAWAPALIPLLLVAVHPRVIHLANGLFQRVARRPVAEWEGSWRDGAVLLGMSLIGWVVLGVSFYLMVQALAPVGIAALPLLVAANAAAFLAGYLVFVAPAGLGAKEGALAALLSLLFPLPVAVALAVAARVWTVVAELVPALFLLRRSRPPNP